MFDHVTIRASDKDAALRFYGTVLDAIGVQRSPSGPEFPEWGDFSIAQATDERPVTRRLHIGFAAPSRAAVDAFWRAGVDAGYRSDGEPGERPQYTPSYYGAFLLDPDGNSAEAVHHDGVRTDGNVDHLWFRVPDPGATRDFYDAVADHAPIRRTRDLPERVTYERDGAGGGTFSAVPGEPTANVHVAFLAPDRATVDAFHAAALAAGYADEGAPGPRPEYHAGYYGAFVRDPDGHVIESVHHTR